MKNQTEITANVVTKRSGKGGAVAAVLAVAVVGGAGASYAMVPAVRNTVKMAVMKPDKYCASVYQNAVDKLSKSLDEKVPESDENTVSMTMTAKLDDTLMEPLRSQTGCELFKEISVGLDSYVDGEDVTGSMVLSADKNNVLTFNVIKSGNDMYVQMPEASGKYLLIPADFEQMPEQLRSRETITVDEAKSFITRYPQILADFIGDCESEIEKGVTDEIEDVAYKYNVITTVIDSKSGAKLLSKFADEMENDEVLKQSNRLNGNDDDDFKEMIESFRDKIEEYKGNKNYKLTVKTFVDAEGNIRGVNIKEKGRENSDENIELEFMEAKEGDDIVVLFKASDIMKITLTARDDKGSYTGKLKFDIDGEKFNISFEDISVIDDKFISGNISFDAEELTDGKVKKISLAFDESDGMQKISTSIPDAGSIVFTYKTSKGEKQEITKPADAIDISDEANIDKYMEDVDIEKFLNDVLTALGIDKDYSSMLIDSMTGGMLGGYGSIIDDSYFADDMGFSINDNGMTFGGNDITVDDNGIKFNDNEILSVDDNSVKIGGNEISVDDNGVKIGDNEISVSDSGIKFGDTEFKFDENGFNFDDSNFDFGNSLNFNDLLK